MSLFGLVVTGFTVACYRLSPVFPIVDAHHNWWADRAGFLSMNSVLDFDFAKRTTTAQGLKPFPKRFITFKCTTTTTTTTTYYYYYYYY
jgi:hypothetical protein